MDARPSKPKNDMQKNTPPAKEPAPFCISSFDIKSLQNLYLLTLVFFAPFIINFTFGNHDWGWIREDTPLLSGIFEGRYSQFILQTLLFSGRILPVITIITALAFYAAAAVLLAKLWHMPLKQISILLLSLNLITAPYTISWLYFAFIELSCLSWPLFVVLGFYLLSSPAPTKRSLTSFFLSTLLFTLALGGYPPVINMIAIIFFSLILNSLCLDNTPPKSILKTCLPPALAILLALTLMLTIQYFLKKYHLQAPTYNTAAINLSTLFSKLQTTFRACFTQLTATTSFIPPFYKISTLCLVVAALLRLLKTTPKHPLSLLIFIASVLGLLFSSSITLFAAQNEIYVLNEPRIEFFGLIYIYIFSASVLLKSPRPLIRNITSLILFLLLIHNINTLAYAAKVWHLGFKAETALAERIISRFEQNKNFNPSEKYTFIQGGTLDFRSRYYLKDNTKKTDSYTKSAPYIPWHLPSKAYQFYYPQNFITEDFDIFWSYVPVNAVTKTPDLINYIKYAAAPWPHENAIFITPSLIILTLTPDGAVRARNWLQQQ